MVESAERGMNVGPGHGALATVGKAKLAAVGQLVGVYVDFFMRQRRPDWHALLALDNLIIARELVIVGLVRREIGGIWLLGILDGARRRKGFVTVG